MEAGAGVEGAKQSRAEAESGGRMIVRTAYHESAELVEVARLSSSKSLG
jgi:hypothetical protein